jgi:hypothetical protein
MSGVTPSPQKTGTEDVNTRASIRVTDADVRRVALIRHVLEKEHLAGLCEKGKISTESYLTALNELRSAEGLEPLTDIRTRPTNRCLRIPPPKIGSRGTFLKALPKQNAAQNERLVGHAEQSFVITMASPLLLTALRCLVQFNHASPIGREDLAILKRHALPNETTLRVDDLAWQIIRRELDDAR